MGKSFQQAKAEKEKEACRNEGHPKCGNADGSIDHGKNGKQDVHLNLQKSTTLCCDYRGYVCQKKTPSNE